MHKNQLQELAQISSFNLPAYSCIREGPDHAPRFKATVNFNGELFESPEFFTTLRQAEHAAAEVALNVLSKRGPSQSLAAKVLDETGICKNLLQETAQRAGVSLPVYTTIKGGLVPLFNCTVEVGGRVFAGEPAKSKKQAEKNAAMAAWSSLKQWTQPPRLTGCEDNSTSEKSDRNSSSRGTSCALTPYKRDGRAQMLSRSQGGRSRIRMVNVREQSRLKRDSIALSPAREESYESRRFLFNQHPTSTSRDVCQSATSHQRSHLEGSLASSPSTERSYASQRFLFNQQPHSTGSDLARTGGSSSTHQRSHSLSGLAFDSSILLPHETLGSSGGSSGGGYLGSAPLPRQRQPRASRLSLQSSSDRIELRRPLVEEFQREGDSDWFSALMGTTSTTRVQQQQQQQQQQQSPTVLQQSRRAQSERFELKSSLFDELYQKDEEEWWFREEMLHPERERVASYEGGDTGKYMLYNGRKGSFEPISHISDRTNEPGTVVGSPYNRRWRKANSSYLGYDSNAGQRGSLASHYNEHSDVPTLYGAFSTASQVGRDSYGGFNVNPSETSFFSNDAFVDTFSGHCNPPSRGHDIEGTIPSSPSRWLHSSQWLNSPPSSPSSTAAHTLGLRTSSLAPPVRVRKMVAVCSASPTRSMPSENNAVANMSNSSLHYSDCMEASTGDIFKHLSLE